MRRGGVQSPNPKMLRVYDGVVVPVTKAVESRVRPPFGQSVLAVARVPSSSGSGSGSGSASGSASGA